MARAMLRARLGSSDPGFVVWSKVLRLPLGDQYHMGKLGLYHQHRKLSKFHTNLGGTPHGGIVTVHCQGISSTTVAQEEAPGTYHVPRTYDNVSMIRDLKSDHHLPNAERVVRMRHNSLNKEPGVGENLQETRNSFPSLKFPKCAARALPTFKYHQC
jgi:hypothetical protein